jgi:hypothetical protein
MPKAVTKSFRDLIENFQVFLCSDKNQSKCDSCPRRIAISDSGKSAECTGSSSWNNSHNPFEIVAEGRVFVFHILNSGLANLNLPPNPPSEHART